jgi:hypothetical protein
VYNAFELDADADENLKAIIEKGKCKLSTLSLNGEFIARAKDMESMLSEMYENFSTNLVPESGHYIAEENSRYI